MWRLPLRETAEAEDLTLLHRRKYGITRYRVTLHVHECRARHAAATVQPGEEWILLDALEEIVIPPADRSAIQAVRAALEEIA